MVQDKSSNKNVLLLSTNFEDIPELMGARQPEKDELRLCEETYYPLGISYIHSYIESKGFSVESLSFNSSSYKAGLAEVIKKINKHNPGIVGFQMLTANRASTCDMVEYLHKHYPKIKIIIGGIHATIFYERLVKKFPYAFIVIGEGEKTFLELITKIKKNKKNFGKVKGIAYMDKGKVKVTKPRPLIENLDMLPFPKHEAFFMRNRKDASILTTRGCPFACSFCCLKSISKRKVRYRSVKNVVDEIEHLVKSFPKLEEIMIQDDSFFLDNKRVIKICDEILKRKIRINFTCSGRMKPISKEMIKKLEQANFKRVLLGLESGDIEVLKRTHKGILPRDAINAFNLFKNSPIELRVFLIVGLPRETEKTISNTIRLIKKLQRIKYMRYEGAPLRAIYPGTEIYEIAKKGKLIEEDFWFSEKGIKIFTLENDYETLQRLRKRLLDNIAYTHLKTWSGFKAQFFMLPYIVKYILLYKKRVFLSTLKKILFPKNE